MANSIYNGLIINDENLRRFKSTPFSVPANSTIDTGIDVDKFIMSVTEAYVIGLPYAPVGTIDTDNIGSLEAGIIDGDTNSISYNNNAAGQFPLNFYGVDLGAILPMGSVDLYWWLTNPNYNATNFEIQVSDDGITWTTVVTGLDSTNIVGNQSILLPAGTTGRYLRPRIITPENVSYVVLTQITVMGDVVVQYRVNDGIGFYVNLDNTVKLVNQSTNTGVGKIIHL